jgi:density-regulated protein DRP1
LEDKLANLTVEQREALDKDIAKKEKKEEAKAEKEKARVAVRLPSCVLPLPTHLTTPVTTQASKVIIKRIERNKRKYVTGVHGLEAFGVDLKKAAKLFANKFATGASLSKNPQGEEEIFIQGDVSDEVRPCSWLLSEGRRLTLFRLWTQVEEMILDEEDKKAVAVFGGRIGEDQIEFVEDKPKKKPPPTIAPQ